MIFLIIEMIIKITQKLTSNIKLLHRPQSDCKIKITYESICFYH